MRRGGTYKHERCTDVALVVHRLVHVPQKQGYKAKVEWLNIVNPKNVFPCGLTEEIFIPAAEMERWKQWPEEQNASV